MNQGERCRFSRQQGVNLLRKVKIASLFSGIGGFEEGIYQSLGKENVEVVFSSEIDKYATKAYSLLHNHTPHGDITQIDAADVPDHDVLVGGFPCQSFSIAGKRAGFEDKTRGTLFFEIARIVKEKKTPYLILENVKGLVNHDKGKTLQTILDTLHELNYTIHFRVLNSKLYNCPQNRERVFFVCKLNDPDFSYEFPAPSTKNSVLRDILEENVDERFFLKDEQVARFIPKTSKGDIHIVGNTSRTGYQSENVHLTSGISPTILARDYHGSKQIIVEGNIPSSMDSAGRIYSHEGISPTLCARADSPQIIIDGQLGDNQFQDHIVMNPDGISKCLLGTNSKKLITSESPFRIRRLTPLECFRVQSFPDTYHDIPKENGLSNTQLYKMAGNAVSPNVIKALFDELKEELYANL